jgi:iron donor protein CyaY
MHVGMDETRYHAIADATLMHCHDQLEEAYDAGLLDELDLAGGILTIITASGRTYLVTKHSPSLQVWYASPVTGGHHFRFDDAGQQWQLPGGTTLYDMLVAELAAESVKVIL